MKKFWESNYGGQGYDAVARRKGMALEPPATVAPVPTSRNAPAAAGRAGGRTPLGGYRSASSMSNEAVQQLQAQVADLSGQLEGLEKERDFYFEKVRGAPAVILSPELLTSSRSCARSKFLCKSSSTRPRTRTGTMKPSRRSRRYSIQRR